MKKIIKKRKDGVTQSYWVGNVEKKTINNKYFRKVIMTAPDEQLVLMSIPVGQDIGVEKHSNLDQFIRIEKGRAKFVVSGIVKYGRDGDAVIIPRGKFHNVINVGNEPLKIYTLYSRKNHPIGQIDKTRADAMIREKMEHKK